MKWLKCSEALPQNNQQVLVYPTAYPTDTKWFRNNKFYEEYCGNDPLDLEIREVEFWMPIPPVPKEQAEKTE